MRKLLLTFLLLAFLAACSGNVPDSPASSTETPADTGPVSDLAKLILNSGDLPDEIIPTDFSEQMPAALSGAPRADVISARTLEWIDQAGGGEMGFVVGLVYGTPQELDAAWETITEDLFTFEALDNVGERAAADFNQLAFTRCQTLVFIRMDGVYLEEDIIPFARRVDRRLAQEGCLY